MDWLEAVFLGAFIFGLLFCVVSLLLGTVHLGFGHHGLHLHGLHGAHGLHGGHGLHGAGGHPAHAAVGSHGHHGPPNGGAASGPTPISPWNLTGLTAFVAWFGGVGYLAFTGWELAAWTSLLLAAAAGLLGWWIIYQFFNRVLLKNERWMDPSDYRLEGTVARVTMPIAGGRIGEIQYTLAGVRHSDGARSLDGSPLERDAEVVIVQYDGGIAYVQPWQEFVKGSTPDDRAGGS